MSNESEWIHVEIRGLFDGWAFRIHGITHEVEWRDIPRIQALSEAQKEKHVQEMINHFNKKNE